MFSPTKRVMAIYMPLLAKMAKDNPIIIYTKVNFELFCDVIFSFLFLVCCPCLKVSMHRREMSLYAIML